MPKARRSENRPLPARWRYRHGAYTYRVPPGLESLWDGKREFRLGATLQEAYATFGKRMAAQPQAGRTVADAIARYMTEVSPQKATTSWENDQYAAPLLTAAFGGAPLAQLPTPADCYAYIDARGAPVQGRKEISLLSAVLSEAVRWGWIPANPLLRQVRTRAVRRPARYVTDDEFIAAALLAPAWLQSYLLIKLATGLRQADMCGLRVRDVQADGLHVMPSKTRNTTARRLVFVWSPTLRAEVDRVVAGRADPGAFLFLTARGKPFVKTSFQAAWQRLMVKVKAAGIAPFSEHDIRGKAGSDADDAAAAQRLLAHASAAVTMRHYRRAAERIRPS